MVDPIPLGPYTDGVNLIDHPLNLKRTELSLCKNQRVGPRGNQYKRPGHDNYGSSPAKINGDALVNLLVRYYKSDGSKLLIGAAGGKLRKGDDGTGAWTDIDINGTGASMAVSTLADWTVYKNRLYLADGVNPIRYNMVDAIYAGFFVHPAPVFVSQTTGGFLTTGGLYKYFVVSRTTDMGDGPAGSILSVQLTGGNNKINITVPVSAPVKHEEASMLLYRTKANGDLYYLVGAVTPGGAYTDTMADSSLGTTEYIQIHVPRADSRFVITGHDERTYWFGRAGANASIVEASDVGFPDRIPDNSFFTVSNNDGDILTGGGLTPGGIVFFKKTSLWLLRAFGYGLTNIYPKEKKGSGVGSTAPFSIVTTPVGLIFLSQKGEIYLFDGAGIKEIGRNVSPEFKGMTQATISRVVACYHDYRYQISYDFRNQKGYNWKTLEYDVFYDKWDGPHENVDLYTPSYYSVWDSVLDSGQLAWGESKAANGSYARVRSDLSRSDRGSKYVSTVRTGANQNNLGDVKSTKIFVHAELSSGALLTASQIDERGNKVSVDIQEGSPIVGSKLNGTDNLGGLGAVPPIFKLGGSQFEVLEDSFGPEANSKLPIYELSDSGSASEMNITQVMVMANILQPK